MSTNNECPICEKRKHVRQIQASGRVAATQGKKRSDNPHSDPVEKQYWEYGWIEENFMNEIEEHRAVMEYAGEHLFLFSQEVEEWTKAGEITPEIRDRIVSSMASIAQNLADKLRGN